LKAAAIIGEAVEQLEVSGKRASIGINQLLPE
jgi:hypothetical protein